MLIRAGENVINVDNVLRFRFCPVMDGDPVLWVFFVDGTKTHLHGDDAAKVWGMLAHIAHLDARIQTLDDGVIFRESGDPDPAAIDEPAGYERDVAMEV